MKKKKMMGEKSRKKKRRIYPEDDFEESSSYEESSSADFVDIEDEIHHLLKIALEDEDWSVHDVVTMLCNEMKYVVGNYE